MISSFARTAIASRNIVRAVPIHLLHRPSSIVPIDPKEFIQINRTSNRNRPFSMSHRINPDPREQYPKPPFTDQKEQEWPGTEDRMSPRADHGENSYVGTGKLKDHVALISGGDSGIGRAVAIAFAREGCDVAIAHLPQEQADADECRKICEATGRKFLSIPCDLSEKSACSEIVEKTVQQFGKITILVNNAAAQGKAIEGLHKMEYERVLNTFKVNIISFFETSKAAIKYMPAGGSIINTGSIQGYDPTNKILDYACTKAAIHDFTKGLAEELIEKGIRVNCVAPGPIWTPLVTASFPTDKLKDFGGSCPMKRPGQPAELAPAYVFLASKDSSFVTGQILGVTGGKFTP